MPKEPKPEKVEKEKKEGRVGTGARQNNVTIKFGTPFWDGLTGIQKETSWNHLHGTPKRGLPGGVSSRRCCFQLCTN